MWNPFKSVKLKPVVPSTSVSITSGTDAIDPADRVEYERLKMRSLLARTQIAMIHESLAERALHHIRGQNICPD